MNYLPIKKQFRAGMMVARFLREPSQDEMLLVGIPGGPGLSGRYLDPFMVSLSSALKCNVGMVDLPNHDESPESPGLHYSECLEYVAKTLKEIQGQCKEFLLFGQSFGARLAFDAVSSQDVSPKALMLCGFPYKFQSSAKLYQQLEQLSLQPLEGNNIEQRFADNWRKIIPSNLKSPISDADNQALGAGTKWIGNEHMLEGAPTLDGKHIFSFRIAILEGEHDLVVPDGNLETLTYLLPEARIYKIAGAGHFPMIEKPRETIGAFSDFLRGNLA